VNRVQRLPNRIEDAKEFISSSMFSTAATHIITGIEWGIDLIVVLQLPSDANTVKEIDHVLDKLLQFLLNDDITFAFTPDEESLLERIVHTGVYANTPDLNNLTTVRDVCRCIKENTNNLIEYPISYTLRPINCLNSQYEKEGATFIPLAVELNDKIEDYVLQLIADIKKLEVSLTENVSKLLGEHLKQQLLDVEKQWLDVKDKFDNEIKRLSNIVIELRSGQNKNLVIEQVLSNNEQTSMKNSIHDLTQNLKYLEEKGQLLNLNVAERIIRSTDIEITVEDQSVQDDQRDYLNQNNAEQLQKPCSDSEEESENSSIYADYSHGALDSSSTMISPPDKDNHEAVNGDMSYVSSTTAKISSPLPVDLDKPRTISSLLPVPSEETINILLLGETGVGKSTFINAFANYLTFDTIQEAQIGHPVVLIPVSFLITVGDNFDEHNVKFGDIDASNNEDFNHPGQSVTQRCKSYVFNTHGKKLCIIDTPGFGDTRGLGQDDLNMQHVLEYIKDISHLNSICFLLKPNESRLNIFYRSCLIQVCSLLKSNPSSKIVFCFTNARSTFYTPGDTAPLLKKMLASLPTDAVPFIRDNTFCFDSESFRYLVALQNGVSFNELERNEYEMSWTKSVTDANRLVHYICKLLND